MANFFTVVASEIGITLRKEYDRDYGGGHIHAHLLSDWVRPSNLKRGDVVLVSWDPITKPIVSDISGIRYHYTFIFDGTTFVWPQCRIFENTCELPDDFYINDFDFNPRHWETEHEIFGTYFTMDPRRTTFIRQSDNSFIARDNATKKEICLLTTPSDLSLFQEEVDPATAFAHPTIVMAYYDDDIGIGKDGKRKTYYRDVRTIEKEVQKDSAGRQIVHLADYPFVIKNLARFFGYEDEIPPRPRPEPVTMENFSDEKISIEILVRRCISENAESDDEGEYHTDVDREAALRKLLIRCRALTATQIEQLAG